MTTDKKYWLALTERYFDGLTTEHEERLLRQFASTPMAQAEEFEELRAVMAYLATGKALRQKKSAKFWLTPGLIKWSAAACIFIIGGIGIYRFMPRTTYIAYIDGQRTTNKVEVIAQMHSVMADINANTLTTTMEASMNNLMNTLNTKE
jgi:hypothetical protein